MKVIVQDKQTINAGFVHNFISTWV